MTLEEYQSQMASKEIGRGRLAQDFREPSSSIGYEPEYLGGNANKLKVEIGPDLSHMNPKYSQRNAERARNGWRKASKKKLKLMKEQNSRNGALCGKTKKRRIKGGLLAK